MITNFICDQCKEETKGAPHGYPEEGNFCINCWIENELSYCRTIIKGHEINIDRLFGEIQKELIKMDGLREQRE